MDSQQVESFFQTGYHGKIPGRGDFIYNGLSRNFIDSWDAWLQGAIASSRNRLMDEWPSIYLSSPIWRYYLAPGLCGGCAWIGVVMPSVDKAGRYFPLTVACSLPAEFNPFTLMTDRNLWFVEVEELMLSLLDEDQPDVIEFDQKIEQLSYRFKQQECVDKKPQGSFGHGSLWHLPLMGVNNASQSSFELSWRMLAARFSTYSLWWSDGSEQVNPSLLVSAGLPEGESFTAMIDGQWTATNWETWPFPRYKQCLPEEESGFGFLSDELSSVDKLKQEKTLLTWNSTAMTHVGLVRSANEDACLELPEQGIWVVADGMGGHALGELASMMVVDDLSRLERSRTLGEFVDDARTCLRLVNQKLLEKARIEAVPVIGCTVVVLLMMGQRAALLWAGDSRIYLSRKGKIQQLTKDHSYDEVVQFGHNDSHAENFSNVITRAVGADNELYLDVSYIDLKSDDCFLLCSDGLNKEVTDAEIAESMCGVNALAGTQQLLDLSLERGGRDNVTIITVQLSDIKESWET
ncbi:MAG TPA: type VI secretion system-associated protein TagF [Thermodesulfobacteriaceae bacterium]|nr:type VI secretion system-associated protein TagF [Thermodesulfobacteriaceae bacterium]